MKCCSVRMKCCSYNFYIIDGHLWSLYCSIKMNAEFLHHTIFTKGRWRSLILKFQLRFWKSTIFGWSAAECRMKCCSFKFYIIDGHLWSLQCLIKIHAEFLHRYLFTKGRWKSLILKFQLIFSKSTIFGWSAAVLEWNAAVIIFT